MVENKKAEIGMDGLGLCRKIAACDFAGFPQYRDDLVSAGLEAFAKGSKIKWGMLHLLRSERRHEIDHFEDISTDSEWHIENRRGMDGFREFEFWHDIKAKLLSYRSANHRPINVAEYIAILRLRAAGFEYREIGNIFSKSHKNIQKKVELAKMILLEEVS